MPQNKGVYGDFSVDYYKNDGNASAGEKLLLPRRASSFSRGVISRALAFRSLYYP